MCWLRADDTKNIFRYGIIRTQEWRQAAMQNLHLWEMDLDYARAQIPEDERQRTPPNSEYVPSSPLGPEAETRKIYTRSQTRRAPQERPRHSESSDSSDSDSNQVVPSQCYAKETFPVGQVARVNLTLQNSALKNACLVLSKRLVGSQLPECRATPTGSRWQPSPY
ncbi:predicted protein [Uncinocarpus reesii 1704]|uniref:Uncharacterized protein n=1 Tax=Uncinocarpus reesii (strain UAMH 1704) TaxID=336963 RepID=C4JS98_UNCRE|nr:uncharacterized protein UREG_05337 [Uncinocarpus reesii 1704]EEP80495.1 predicted protein [Uncinocarpus reesii 1704]